ncbi:MAG: alanine racemase [Candidatus Gastranaerophilaceae bacterium]
MRNVRQSNINIHRDSWVEINLENLAFNIKNIKKNTPDGVRLLAVVKADAYGHGSVMLAPTLLASGADMLGVASIDEGVDLRQAKINCEILVLGAVPVWAVESAVKADLSISVFSKEHLEACRQAYVRTGIKPKVHIKLDTGMNRIGVSTDDAVEFINNVRNSEYIDFQGIFTHLANAENREKTQLQIDKWNKVISQIDTTGLLLHILNTAGAMCYDVPNSNMRRAGIALYGLYPDLPQDGKVTKPDLKPVLSLKARVVNIHDAQDGEGVSYGHTFTTHGTRTIATIPLGYADGVPRGLSNKIFGTINGKKVPQVGNITMDQMMFDITGVEASLGDVISLLDENNTIDEWAKILGTINYELTCRLKVRLPRVYTR